MDIELLPTTSLLPETFSVLIPPVELLAGTLNSRLELQRWKCAAPFQFLQLMTIQEENHHSFLIAEHDPMLYMDDGHMVEYIAQAPKQTSGRRPSCSARQAIVSPPAEDDGAVRYDNVTELSLRTQFLVSTAKTNFKAKI